jgi:hypothetical protein
MVHETGRASAWICSTAKTDLVTLLRTWRDNGNHDWNGSVFTEVKEVDVGRQQD